MEAFFNFASNHPILTFFLSWGIWPACWAVTHVLTYPFKVAYMAYKMHLRAGNIRAHGWPKTPLMDADGDIMHPKPPEKKS